MSGKKTLVTYNTKSGATGEYAKTIAEALRTGYGHEVTVVDLKEEKKPDIAPYDNIFVGSGIRAGMWYGRAKGMLKRDYAGKKVALFVASGRAADPEQKQAALESYVNKVMGKYPKTQFVGGTAFAGWFKDKSVLTPVEDVKAWVDEIVKKMDG